MLASAHRDAGDAIYTEQALSLTAGDAVRTERRFPNRRRHGARNGAARQQDDQHELTQASMESINPTDIKAAQAVIKAEKKKHQKYGAIINNLNAVPKRSA